MKRLTWLAPLLAVALAVALAQPAARIVSHELQADRPWRLPSRPF